jgi:hypothetical protein
MSISDLQLPTDLNLDDINKTFQFIKEYLIKNQENQNDHHFLLKKQITEDVEHAITSLDTSSLNNKMIYVDIYSVHGILTNISNKINTKLQQLTDNLQSQELVSEKLISKVNQSVKLLQTKNKTIEKQLKDYLNYSKTHFQKSLQKSKTKKIFSHWKTTTKNSSKAKKILKNHLKKQSNRLIQSSFSNWKQKVGFK